MEKSAIILRGWPRGRLTSKAAFPQQAVLWKEALIGSFQDIRGEYHGILNGIIENRFLKIIAFIVGI